MIYGHIETDQAKWQPLEDLFGGPDAVPSGWMHMGTYHQSGAQIECYKRREPHRVLHIDHHGNLWQFRHSERVGGPTWYELLGTPSPTELAEIRAERSWDF